MKQTTTFLKNTCELHNDKSLKQQATKHRKTIEGVTEKPYEGSVQDIIKNLMQEINDALDDKQRNDHLESIKHYLHQTAVVKEEEISEKYRSKLNLSDEDKVQRIQTITEDQKDRINTWLNYLADQGTLYPIELKYWAIKSILGLGIFNHKAGKFFTRKNLPTQNFPELNQEALAHVLASKQAELEGSQIQNFGLDEKEFQQFCQKKNFAHRYSIAFKASLRDKNQDLTITKGEWKQYLQGSKADELVASLEGQNTGRCTANYRMAKSQLEKGDFYVYYSEKDGANTKPRIAIRMENNKIGEIRGIQENQNLDPYMVDTLGAKLQDLSGSIDNQIETYQDKLEYMRHLNTIENKINNHQELTLSDIIGLYGIQQKGFGYDTDPRIKILQNHDHVLQALSQYSASDEFWEAIAIKTHKTTTYGFQHLKSLPENFTFPTHLNGNLNLRNLTSLPDNITFPQTIEGSLDLHSLTSLPDNITFPQTIEGSLDLTNLTSLPDNITFPQTIEGSLYLNNLTSLPDNIAFLQTIEGDLNLSKLTSLPDNITFLQTIRGDLNLSNLTSLPDNITFPQTIQGGALNLRNLTSLPDNTTFPQTIVGALNLSNLTSLPDNITFPQTIVGDLNLSNLTSLPDNITFPQTIVGALNLSKLTSLPENYKFPEGIRTIINTVSTKKESEQKESE